MTSSHIISEKFTGFDAWPFGSRRLCVPCAWAYSRPPRVLPAMVITADTVTEYPASDSLLPLLSAGALPNTHAAVVPSSRRRHILATAEWGHLATEGLVVPWDSTAASRLLDLTLTRPPVTRWVRSRATDSTSEPQIAMEIDRTLLGEMPPHALLTTLPRDSWRQFLTAWRALQPWRTVTPMWAAARALTNVLSVSGA